jgi:hypothetical protein
MVKRRLSLCVLLAILATGAVTVRADSTPTIQGGVFGLELCPQSICRAAIFVATFNGLVNGRPALGTVNVAVTHEDLPPLGGTSDITGGVWSLQLLSGRKFSGKVTDGSIFQFDTDLFQVSVDMQITSGGTGTLGAVVILSHRAFPPTISGAISQ